MSVKLLTENHLEFLSSKGGCTGSSESTLVKIPHCWKSHVMAHMLLISDSWVNCNDSRMILCQLEEVLQAQAYILFYKRILVKQETFPPPLLASDSESSDLSYSLTSEDTIKYSLQSQDTVKYSLNSEGSVEVGVDGNLVTGSKSSPAVLSNRKIDKQVLENSAKRGSPVLKPAEKEDENSNSVETLVKSDTLVLENSMDTAESDLENSAIQGTPNSIETRFENSPRTNSKYPVTRSQTGSLKRSLDNDDVYIYGEFMYPKKARRRSTDSERLPSKKDIQNQNNSAIMSSEFVKDNRSVGLERTEENNFLDKPVTKKPKIYDAEHIIQGLNTHHVLKRRKSTFW